MYQKDLSLGPELSELTRTGNDSHIFSTPCHEVGKRAHRHCHEIHGVGPELDDKGRFASEAGKGSGSMAGLCATVTDSVGY